MGLRREEGVGSWWGWGVGGVKGVGGVLCEDRWWAVMWNLLGVVKL